MDSILGQWRHSHEEDSPTQTVFRPASFRFPPSRGRIGFEFKPDGSYVDVGTGPADGPTASQGSWTVEDNVLTLECDAYPGRIKTLRIVSCGPDRLVVEK